MSRSCGVSDSIQRMDLFRYTSLDTKVCLTRIFYSGVRIALKALD